MGTKKLTKQEQDAQNKKERAENELGLLTDLGTARAVAQRLFSTTVPAEDLVMNCHKRIFAFDTINDQTEAITDLTASLELAKKVVNEPTAALVFYIFDELYAAVEIGAEADESDA